MSTAADSSSLQAQASDYQNVTDFGPARLEGRVLNRYLEGSVQSWLENISALAQQPDSELIYRMRNRIYRVADPLNADEQLCIKAFKRPRRLRSLWYRRRGSKAARAHQYAEHLYARGAGVTEPIGYLERYEGNRLMESYLVSRLLPETSDLYTEMNFLFNQRPNADDFVRLMRVTAEACRVMHDAGFKHNDLGPQNILLRRYASNDGIDWGEVSFIDLNRGALKTELTLKDRAEDLARLRIPSHFMGIFRQIYFGDQAVPAAFSRHEQRKRQRIMWHYHSRKWRHPIRTLRKALAADSVPKNLEISSGKPDEQNAWLWDPWSAQPSVVLKGKDRKRYRTTSDLITTVVSNLRHGLRIRRHYKARQAQAYQQPVTMDNRLGVCVEVDGQIDQQLKLLRQTPGLRVLVRVYYHRPELRTACYEAIQRLHKQGHPVAVGLIQSRRAVIQPEQWQAFVQDVVRQTHAHVHLYEVGHAVNRAKWGFWTLDDMQRIWQGIAELRQSYPEHQFLGPAINDFEFHYYPPLLDRTAHLVDALPGHLYVDRRGAPENFQGRFSTLEKCLYGKAVADAWGKRGFYVTEINWPLKDTGLYSPIAGTYMRPDLKESELHVDEHTSAAYMIRFALIAACSGAVETTYWWRLAHHGFGLVDDLNGWRERPGWKALVQFHKHLSGLQFTHREEKQGAIWWHFEGPQRSVTLVHGLKAAEIDPPEGVERMEDQYGTTVEVSGNRLAIDGSVTYLFSEKGS
ncbi:lipopolysaccharide kinase InaA family protein [Natronospirillum operosum]|nr:lipopolysaccharide kinase InaA family protein [Natronospirillum operosum]